MKDVVLTGLDGSNPLAFLAALGVLEALTDSGCEARLRWENRGVWRPVLCAIETGIDQVVETLDQDRQRCTKDSALALEYPGEHGLKRDLKPPPGVFREYLLGLVSEARPVHRRSIDWAAAFATDVAVDTSGRTKPTALHFTAGQQLFLKMVGDLVTGVTTDDLREAVVGPWRYERPLPVMGWDATASRAYALRASDPSADKKLGVPGADWLAVRGLPSIPVFPAGTHVLTTGCRGGRRNGSFRWGLWIYPINRDVCRSTLHLDLEGVEAAERSARGIGVVFRCGIQRSDEGRGYGSFEPATVV